jgi:hypothetical protein
MIKSVAAKMMLSILISIRSQKVGVSQEKKLVSIKNQESLLQLIT